MANFLDTLDSFETFARKAFLEGTSTRERLHGELYERPLAEVFEAFYARSGDRSGPGALFRELSDVRTRVREAGPAVRAAIEAVEPGVRELLGVPEDPAPLHVLMVGQFSANAVVGRLGDDVAVFHCLEWFNADQATDVLVAHEDAHAWHELALGAPGSEEDATWLAFSEGLAIQASRQVLPGRDEDDYFWYGHAGFEDWLPWCREHRDELVERFAAALDGPDGTDAADAWFGSGLIDGRWRVGYYVADQLVGGLDRPLSDLVRLDAAEASSVVRGAAGLS